MTLLRKSPTLLENLPGEIRNQIFDLCICDAIARAKPPAVQIVRISSRLTTTPTRAQAFKVSVLPQWCGAGSLRTEGIGSLPLLFVNKQVFNEVASLVYSRVEELSIGPYGLQYSNEDPNVRWEYAYKLLQNRPHLQKHAKNVTIHLPWLRHDLLRNYWKSMGKHAWEGPPRESHACAVVPRLARFLRTFDSLSTLKIILVAEVSTPPDMEPLIQLYDICKHRTKVEIISPDTSHTVVGPPSSDIMDWETAWVKALSLSGKG